MLLGLVWIWPAARLGLTHEALNVASPKLVVCDISGYGESGPFVQKKAYDLLIQAESGLISVTGTPAESARVGISIADIATGMYALEIKAKGKTIIPIAWAAWPFAAHRPIVMNSH